MSARGVGRVWMDGHVELDAKAFADMAHRDDLARDVARLWPAEYDAVEINDELRAALDRLAAAYGTGDHA